eukprot:GHVS01064764.1.p1 GENE.GHVS01064764.1~~GHVS01064764.1.p1  ORF type:complete len:382 (-),score=43.05 GHVS01064764.1:383-1528(-)
MGEDGEKLSFMCTSEKDCKALIPVTAKRILQNDATAAALPLKVFFEQENDDYYIKIDLNEEHGNTAYEMFLHALNIAEETAHFEKMMARPLRLSSMLSYRDAVVIARILYTHGFIEGSYGFHNVKCEETNAKLYKAVADLKENLVWEVVDIPSKFKIKNWKLIWKEESELASEVVLDDERDGSRQYFLLANDIREETKYCVRGGGTPLGPCYIIINYAEDGGPDRQFVLQLDQTFRSSYFNSGYVSWTFSSTLERTPRVLLEVEVGVEDQVEDIWVCTTKAACDEAIGLTALAKSGAKASASPVYHKCDQKGTYLLFEGEGDYLVKSSSWLCSASRVDLRLCVFSRCAFGSCSISSMDGNRWRRECSTVVAKPPPVLATPR